MERHAVRKIGELASAKTRGEAAKADWIKTGAVVSAEELSNAWGVTLQTLGLASRQGELFALVIKGRCYYPREFLQVDCKDVRAVCSELRGLSPSEQLVFWKRIHGQLGGKTVLQVLSDLQSAVAPLVLVTALAEAYTAQMRADVNRQGRLDV